MKEVTRDGKSENKLKLCCLIIEYFENSRGDKLS